MDAEQFKMLLDVLKSIEVALWLIWGILILQTAIKLLED